MTPIKNLSVLSVCFFPQFPPFSLSRAGDSRSKRETRRRRRGVEGGGGGGREAEEVDRFPPPSNILVVDQVEFNVNPNWILI